MKKILSVILISQSIGAQTITVKGEEIIIKATRVKTTPKEERVVYVITEEEIEKYDTLPNLLKALTPLGIFQRGGIGKDTSFFIRGAEARHIIVMIDGIKINDPSSPGREADISNILLDDISQIEIIPSPTGVIYGSDGMGGLINIVTKKDKKARLKIEQGSFETIKVGITKGGELKGLGGKAFISYFKTNGFSAYSGGEEMDGYKNLSGSLYLDYLLPSAKLEANIIKTKSESEYDEWKVDDLDNVAFKEDTILGGRITHFPYFNKNISLSLYKTKREYYDKGIKKGTYTGLSRRIDYQNNIKIKNSEFVLGATYEDEEYKEINKNKKNRAIYLEGKTKIKEFLTLGYGVRKDNKKTTYQFLSCSSLENIRIRFNYQQGFKTPSLFQLYAPPIPAYWFIGGNPDLKNEESENIELGIEFEKDNTLLQATHFKNDFKNLIVYYTDPTTSLSTYKNIGSATIEGNEFKVSIKPTKDFSILANYIYLTEGERLKLRPKKRVSISLSLHLLKNLALTSDIIYVGKRIDYSGKMLPAYQVFNIGYLLDVSKNIKFKGRIENLFDEKYEEVFGYGTPRRSFYCGVEMGL